MKRNFDPQKHHRRSIRLKGWDYTSPGPYFITICTYQRMHLFENPVFREIAENAWRAIPHHVHASHVQLDEWVVMPNHLHGIILLLGTEERQISDVPRKGANPSSVSSIVGTYKSMVARQINTIRRSRGNKVWQRGFYERIIRNERELIAIREYIGANPGRWAEDRDNLDSLVMKMQKY